MEQRETGISRRSFIAGATVAGLAAAASTFASSAFAASGSASASAAGSASGSASASASTSGSASASASVSGSASASAAASVSSSAAASASADTTADLIVVGGGAAGMAAAARAAQGGASVILLEAEGATGGTTKISGGHYKFMNSVFLSELPARSDDTETELKKLLDYDPSEAGDYADAVSTVQDQIDAYLLSEDPFDYDSVEKWLTLHWALTQGTDLDGVAAQTDYSVVAPAYYNSGRVYDWMAIGGLTFSVPNPDNVGNGGPLSVEPTGQGAGLVQGLETMATEAGVQIVLSTKATALVQDGDKVTGVVATDANGNEVTYAANVAVLLATGGFASNTQMVVEKDNCNPVVYSGVGSCEPASNDGTGITMAEAVGGVETDMQFIQYMTFPKSGMATIEQTIPMVMGGAKMCVNKEGERFYDDSMRFTYSLTGISLGQSDGCYYMIGDSSNITAMGDAYDTFTKLGAIFTGDTIEEAATAAGIDPDATAASVEKFNSYVDAGSDPDFGRQDLSCGKVDGAPYVVIAMSEYAQNTMGGIIINSDGNVVDKDGNAIEGLYAAGEVTGNFDGANRRHGDNYAQILYYGWLVGKTVAEAVAQA